VEWHAFVVVPIGTDLVPAVFGLLGVLAGGLVTWGVAFRQGREQEQREYGLALKLAKAEIDEIVIIVKDAIDHEHWPPGLKTKSWAQSWSTNRRALAMRMDRETFKAVAAAYSLADQFQNGLSDRADQPAPKGSRDRKFLLDVQKAFGDAGKALTPLDCS
jgi:hypothetical protein